ncbi:hypothetical protein E2C01_053422 [Portunus trituberculatus]|uniref:Uncharacterized protein n=1 Tax=Portunus trituberculatus TaxID=210409 RepID=A0A5B7GPA6_PORTR|nr:hypothetical protein [Portunus trituberculatus]
MIEKRPNTSRILGDSLGLRHHRLGPEGANSIEKLHRPANCNALTAGQPSVPPPSRARPAPPSPAWCVASVAELHTGGMCRSAGRCVADFLTRQSFDDEIAFQGCVGRLALHRFLIRSP